MMELRRFRSAIVAVFLICFACTALAQLPQQEINAINAFRATVDPEPAQWLNITDPCALTGIYCNTTDGALHVLDIGLSSSVQKKASIGSWIGSLPYLQTLQFSLVNLTAPISNSLSTLTRFTSLQLQGCNNVQLPSTLPPSIGSIFISDSDLKKMPNLVGCTSALSVTISACPSLVDTIPAHYATLTNMKFLYLSSLPGLTGSIPNFGSSLYTLEISSTQVSGQIPSISVFFAVTLHNNALTGTIPGSLFTSTVNSIGLSGNQLTGPIPTQISAATSLNTLSLANNQLSGAIPQQLLGLPLLFDLTLRSNAFTGTVPDLGLMSTLKTADLSFNQFSGTLPVFTSAKLYSVRLNNNKISGTIPQAALAVKSVSDLDLSFNQLNGTIPPIGTFLATLNLNSNQLTGSVPMTNGLNLAALSISNNLLTGTIPLIGSSVEVFAAAGNQLTGFLPTMVGDWLAMLDLSNNQLFGDIPPVYSSLQNIIALDLSNNQFSGCFSGKLPQMKGCALAGNFLCCAPEESGCNTDDLDCPNCPTPSPDAKALCQYDKSRKALWVVLSDLVIDEPTTLYNTIVYGDFDSNSDLNVNGGVIQVKGCADVGGSSLTVQLTPEEIEQLIATGVLERQVLTFNSTCDNGVLEFSSLSYQGNIPCTNTSLVQQNTANSITVIVTSQKVTCPGDIPDWGIGIIVAGCVVIAGAAIGIGLGVTQKKKQRTETRIRSRLSSAGANRPVSRTFASPQTNSGVALDNEPEEI